jgi:Flp pilus assembly pilin Flp
MTEYILIVALIALFVIAGVKIFSKKTEQGFKDAGDALSGEVNKAIKHGGKN